MREREPAIRIREYWEKVHGEFPRGATMMHYSDNHGWRRAVLEFGDKVHLPLRYSISHWTAYPSYTTARKSATARPHAGYRTHRFHGTATASRLIANRPRRRSKNISAFSRPVDNPALTSGELICINNTEPDSVLSFLRKRGSDEVLVILNLSNRKLHVYVDLPVMDDYSVENLLREGKTWFELYSGRVSAHLGAYEEIVGKRIPLAPLSQ